MRRGATTKTGKSAVSVPPKRAEPSGSQSPKAGGAQPNSPTFPAYRPRRSPSPQERAAREEANRQAKEQAAQQQAEQAAEEERRREAELVAQRLAEEEEARNRRPASPVSVPMQMPVSVFMWMRDRVSALGNAVQPCADRKFVVLPAATVDTLFAGSVLLGIANGYLPRSDEQRTQRGAGGGGGSSSLHSSVNTTSMASVTTTMTSHRGPKAHSALAAIKSPSPPPDASTSAVSSPSRHAEPSAELEPVVPRWKAGKFQAMEARYATWNAIRVVCKRLGVEMSPGLLHEIADQRDADSLRSVIEGLHQAVRKADSLRRDYSKSLVDEAAAPTPTHAKALHKAPPLSHTELVSRRLLKPVTLPPLKTVPTTHGCLDESLRPGLPGRTMSSTAGPQHSVHDAQDDSAPSSAPAADSPNATGRQNTPPSSTPEAPECVDAGTQTLGRCVIIFDDPAEDPSGSAVGPEAAAAKAPSSDAAATTTTAPPAAGDAGASYDGGDGGATVPEATMRSDDGDDLPPVRTAPATNAGADEAQVSNAATPSHKGPVETSTVAAESSKDNGADAKPAHGSGAATADCASDNGAPPAEAGGDAPEPVASVAASTADPTPSGDDQGPVLGGVGGPAVGEAADEEKSGANTGRGDTAAKGSNNVSAGGSPPAASPNTPEAGISTLSADADSATQQGSAGKAKTAPEAPLDAGGDNEPAAPEETKQPSDDAAAMQSSAGNHAEVEPQPPAPSDDAAGDDAPPATSAPSAATASPPPAKQAAAKPAVGRASPQAAAKTGSSNVASPSPAAKKKTAAAPAKK